jgi:hypothetical protein
MPKTDTDANLSNLILQEVAAETLVSRPSLLACAYTSLRGGLAERVMSIRKHPTMAPH